MAELLTPEVRAAIHLLIELNFDTLKPVVNGEVEEGEVINTETQLTQLWLPEFESLSPQQLWFPQLEEASLKPTHLVIIDEVEFNNEPRIVVRIIWHLGGQTILKEYHYINGVLVERK